MQEKRDKTLSLAIDETTKRKIQEIADRKYWSASQLAYMYIKKGIENEPA